MNSTAKDNRCRTRFCTGLLACLLACLLAAPARAQPESKLVLRFRGLVELNQKLARQPQPSEGLQELETICGGIVLTLFGLEQGLVEEAELTAVLASAGLEGEGLHYLSPFWQPFARIYMHSSPVDDQLDRLGLAMNPAGDSPHQAIYSFLAYLRLLDLDSDGHPRLATAVHLRYEAIYEKSEKALERLGALRPTESRTRQQDCTRWILSQANPQWYASLHQRVRTDSNPFIVLRESDVPRPGDQNPLANAFRDLALSGPTDYATKWFWHGVLLEEMLSRTRRGNREEVAAGARIYIPSYVLLCHAGAPISVFQPRRAAPDQTFQFSVPCEEDVPTQELFTSTSHLAQVIALRYELRQAGIDRFNPIQHMVCFPYLMTWRSGKNPEVIFRGLAGGYMGYMDIFQPDNVPSHFQVGFPERLDT